MTTNPLIQLNGHGQSVWLDAITRDWLESGQLETWIREQGIRGVTSNPSIFQKAIASSDQYDEQLRELALQGLDAAQIYDALTLDDIRAACDRFRPVYDASGGLDGYVSHEVSPALAYDTWGTIHEARRLWSAVDKPNVMIKIPATAEGLPAIRRCLEDGLNINVTLMFSMAHYNAVAEAYLSALEARLAAGNPLRGVASVASFFVSRVDTHVDALLDARMKGVGDPLEREQMQSLRGEAAVANSKLAYRRYQQLFTGRRFADLERHGARSQRVLWASTSTKDPSYSDVKYVEELIGPHTVNTLPLDTLEAFRDHGKVVPTLTQDVGHAEEVVRALGVMGIGLNEVGATLSKQGVDKFAAALDGVLETVDDRRRSVVEGAEAS